MKSSGTVKGAEEDVGRQGLTHPDFASSQRLLLREPGVGVNV